jgi:F-type H+-transporting ATPase subunit alpha
MAAEKEVMILFAGSQGYLDQWPVEAVSEYEKQMLEYMASKHAGLLQSIKDEGDISDELESKLTAALDEFKDLFQPTS